MQYNTLINRNGTLFHIIKKKYVKGYGFLTFARNLSNKYGKKLLDTATKTGLDAAKTSSKKAVQEIAEATGELIRNKIAGEFVEPNPATDVNSKNVEDIAITTEKRQET